MTQNEMMIDTKRVFDIDFRSDVFLNHSPSMNYDRVKDIVIYANELLVEERGEVREWNLEMDIESIRTTTLKIYLLTLFSTELHY